MAHWIMATGKDREGGGRKESAINQKGDMLA